MNTLHLCHWINKRNFKQHLCLLGKKDSLSIYGQVSNNDKQWLLEQLTQLEQPCYLVNQQSNPNLDNNETDVREINNDQWLTLIIKHTNTLAWK